MDYLIWVIIAFVILSSFMGYVITWLDSLVDNKAKEMFNKEKKMLEEQYISKSEILLNEFNKKNNNMEIEYNLKFKEVIKKENDLAKIIEEKAEGFPFLSEAIADYYYHFDLDQVKYLENKKHPARTSAELVKKHAKEKRQLEKVNRILNYRIKTLTTFYPFLEDVLEDNNSELIKELINIRLESKENHKCAQIPSDKEVDEFAQDELSNWISLEEYQKLDYVSKNQLALDRYVEKKKKSLWEIGRDYEQYIGYLYERDGCKVKYQGMIEGINDLGRDLVVIYPNMNVEIVQCKNWSKYKTIHEKHIFQLYGSLVAYQIDHKSLSKDKIKGHFITSTSLSPRARLFAAVLGISVTENKKLDDFPRIKCNISTHTKEKIFHLPFDQKYDKTIIEASKGEVYAWTVQEAVDSGFRRAFKYRGGF